MDSSFLHHTGCILSRWETICCLGQLVLQTQFEIWDVWCYAVRYYKTIGSLVETCQIKVMMGEMNHSSPLHENEKLNINKYIFEELNKKS